MNIIIIYALLSLAAIAVLSAIILYFVAQKFNVEEDPLIDEVAAILPGANCGGCGYAGCRSLAEAIACAKSLKDLNCPVGGSACMEQIASLLGITAEKTDPLVAVVRCNGSHHHAPAKVHYEGATSCQFAHQLFSGENSCPHGCLGLGDCTRACLFDAIKINKETGLPAVNENKCTMCGMCVKACPRQIIELRPKGVKNRRVYVSCVNKEKGAVSAKNCHVSCIGCGKCAKVCPFEAITLANNLAYIDPLKCKLCRKCVTECPTGAIIEVNFPNKAKETAIPVVEQVVE